MSLMLADIVLLPSPVPLHERFLECGVFCVCSADTTRQRVTLPLSAPPGWMALPLSAPCVAKQKELWSVTIGFKQRVRDLRTVVQLCD